MLSRAMVLTGPGAMEMRSLPVPDAPPPGGAIVRVTANGICGSDWDVYSGQMSHPGGKPAPYPMIPGHEPVGRIVAIDPEARDNWGVVEGDRIAIESRIRLEKEPMFYSLVPISRDSGLWGGMADYMVLHPRTSVFKIAPDMTDEDAVLFNPFGNAFSWTIEAGRAGVGDRVLVMGGGQRGLACAVAAREAGAAMTILTGLSRDAHKLALAPEFGVDHVIDVDREDTVARVLELTDGEGVDLVVDTVPEATAPIVHAIETLRRGGRLVVAGVRGKPMDGFPLELLRSKVIEMVGVQATSKWSVRNALRVIRSGRYPVAKLHSHVFGLEQAEEAIRTLGGQVQGEDPIHITIRP